MMSNIKMSPGRLYLGPPELDQELGEVREATLEIPHEELLVDGLPCQYILAKNDPAELTTEVEWPKVNPVLVACMTPKLVLRWVKLYRPEWLAIGARTKKLRTRRKYADKIFHGYMAWVREVICQWVS